MRMRVVIAVSFLCAFTIAGSGCEPKPRPNNVAVSVNGEGMVFGPDIKCRKNNGEHCVFAQHLRRLEKNLRVTWIPEPEKIVLSPVADWDHAFTGWSGACSGGVEVCTLSLDQDRSVTAKFLKTYYKPRSVLDSNGDLLVAGSFYQPIQPRQETHVSNGEVDIYIAKFSGIDGGAAWSTAFGSKGSDSVDKITLAEDGTLEVVGKANGEIGFPDGPLECDENFSATWLAADGAYLSSRCVDYPEDNRAPASMMPFRFMHSWYEKL